MDPILRDRTLGLAGVFQSALLVQQLARQGTADREALAAILNSTLVTNESDPLKIFGGVKGLKTGLKLARDKTRDAGEPGDVELMRYVIAISLLAHKLQKNPVMAQAIRESIETIQGQAAHFPPDETSAMPHPNVISKLAELYKATLSTLPPRIMIDGDREYLGTPAIADKIRATILGGIRCALIWRGNGGRRWHFLFQRGRIGDAAEEILESA